VIEATESYPFEYWEGYANQLLHGVLPNSQLKRFTRNSALLGTYAEATVYTLLKNMLHPVRVSTGSLAKTTGLLLAKTRTSDVHDGALAAMCKEGDVLYTSDPEDLVDLLEALNQLGVRIVPV
jgi:hypothetical protein